MKGHREKGRGLRVKGAHWGADGGGGGSGGGTLVQWYVAELLNVTTFFQKVAE